MTNRVPIFMAQIYLIKPPLSAEKDLFLSHLVPEVIWT